MPASKAKYSKKAEDKIEKVMHEFKRGELRSSSGTKVKSRKQAVAIGISEARSAGAKVPAKPKAAGSKKRTTASKSKSSKGKSSKSKS